MVGRLFGKMKKSCKYQIVLWFFFSFLLLFFTSVHQGPKREKRKLWAVGVGEEEGIEYKLKEQDIWRVIKVN